MWPLIFLAGLVATDCDTIEGRTPIEAIAASAECALAEFGDQIGTLYVDGANVVTLLAGRLPAADIGKVPGERDRRDLPRECRDGMGCRIAGNDGLLRLRTFAAQPGIGQAWRFEAEVIKSPAGMVGGRWAVCPNVVEGMIARDGAKWVVTSARLTETC